MVVFRELSVDMKSFYSIKVWALFVKLNDFHDFFHGAKRVCFLREVFGKVGGAIVIVPGIFVLSVSFGKLSTCLSNIRLLAVRASEFIHSRM